MRGSIILNSHASFFTVAIECTGSYILYSPYTDGIFLISSTNGYNL